MKQARLPSVVALLAFAVPSWAQVHSDKAIELTGTGAADRQVVGLHDAVQATDALNARTLRAAGYQYAEVGSGTPWQVQLHPAVGVPVAGLRLALRSAAGNAGPVSISLDGNGPYPLVKDGSAPLASGDVLPGEIVSAVFDGTVFQLINSRPLPIRSCPPGSVAVSADFCMETEERDTLYFDEASMVCGQQNGRLCTWSEWWVACAHASQLGLNNMIGDWEWTNTAANSDGQVRVVGQSSCTQSAVTNGWDLVRDHYRCCYRR